MAQEFSWGWDSANSMWRRIACDADGRVIIDPTSLYKGLNIDPQTVYKEQNSQNQILFPGSSQFKDVWDGAIALRFPAKYTILICKGMFNLHHSDDTLFFQATGNLNPGNDVWWHPDAFLVTRHSNITRVRFGNDGLDNWYIIFGETTDSWGYITVSINMVIPCYNKCNVINWDTEIWFEVMTSLPINIDADITDARI